MTLSPMHKDATRPAENTQWVKVIATNPPSGWRELRCDSNFLVVISAEVAGPKIVDDGC